MSSEEFRFPISDRDAQELAKHGTLKQSVAGLIRRALLDGDMRPGEIYSANAMATRLGLSNSPVREAMMSMVNRGLLELVRNRGFRVIELNEQDKREVYDLRVLIEVEAVRRIAAQTVTKEQGEQLRALARRTMELVNAPRSEYLESDQHFHLYLVGLLGNKRWLDIVERLRDLSRVNDSYACIAGAGKLESCAQEHLQIANAVAAGESELAGALMIQHLEYARPECE